MFCGVLALTHPLSHSLHTVPLDGLTERLGEGAGLDKGLQDEDEVAFGVQCSPSGET